MEKHLFITGEIQAGKSTLLQNSLLPYKEYCDGFISQRLVDKAGNTKGFRLADFHENPALTAPFDNTLPDIFMLNENKRIIDLSVFENKGIRIIEEAVKSRRILLLDEIGGVELKSSRFKEVLLDAFNKVPCIGVLKTPFSAEKMRADASEDNAFLLDFITKSDTIIVSYERSRYDEHMAIIRNYIEWRIHNEF